MSNINVQVITQTDVFEKKLNTPTSFVLSQETISRIHSEEKPASQLSQEAIDKNLKELLQARNSTIEINKSQTNAVVNDIDTFFSGMLSHSSVSSLDMGGLISKAIQAPGGSGNSTTMSMDLSVTQAKLNYLVQEFIPSQYQADTLSEVKNYVYSKASAQDELSKDTTRQSLVIAKQQGNLSDEEYLSGQLDLLNAGQHITQTERNDMLSLTSSTTDSSTWFSELRQIVSLNNDTDFFKTIETSHINQLQQEWNQFTDLVSHSSL